MLDVRAWMSPSHAAALAPALQTVVLPGLTPFDLIINSSTRRAFVFSVAPRDRGAVTTLDLDSGRVLQTVLLYDEVAAVASTPGRVLMVGKSHVGLLSSLNVLDARTGLLHYSRRLDMEPTGIAVDPIRRHAFVFSFNSAAVKMLDVRTGRVLRTTFIGSGNGSEARLAVDLKSGLVFANGPDRGVSVLDSRTDALRRTIPVDREANVIVLDGALERAVVTNLTNDAVQLIDTRRGTFIRTTLAGGGPLAIDEATGRVFGNQIGGEPNVLRVLDARTGRLLRAETVNRDVEQGLPVEGGRRVFIRGGNSVSILDGRTGAVLRTTRLNGTDGGYAVQGAAGLMAEDARLGRVVVVDLGPEIGNSGPLGHGDVAVLDSTSGMLLHTIPAGVRPEAVAIDQRTDQAFIVDSGTDAYAGGSIHRPGTVRILDLKRLSP